MNKVKFKSTKYVQMKLYACPAGQPIASKVTLYICIRVFYRLQINRYQIGSRVSGGFRVYLRSIQPADSPNLALEGWNLAGSALRREGPQGGNWGLGSGRLDSGVSEVSASGEICKAGRHLRAGYLLKVLVDLVLSNAEGKTTERLLHFPPTPDITQVLTFELVSGLGNVVGFIIIGSPKLQVHSRLGLGLLGLSDTITVRSFSTRSSIPTSQLLYPTRSSLRSRSTLHQAHGHIIRGPSRTRGAPSPPLSGPRSTQTSQDSTDRSRHLGASGANGQNPDRPDHPDHR